MISDRASRLVPVVLLVHFVLLSRSGAQDCPGLGSGGQELCINIQETDRRGGPTGPEFEFTGPGPDDAAGALTPDDKLDCAAGTDCP